MKASISDYSVNIFKFGGTLRHCHYSWPFQSEQQFWSCDSTGTIYPSHHIILGRHLHNCFFPVSPCAAFSFQLKCRWTLVCRRFSVLLHKIATPPPSLAEMLRGCSAVGLWGIFAYESGIWLDPQTPWLYLTWPDLCTAALQNGTCVDV